MRFTTMMMNTVIGATLALPACDIETTDDGAFGPEVAALDTDGDQVPDDLDNCAFSANGGQRDTDGDGVGDACDLTLVLHERSVERIPRGRHVAAGLAVADVFNFTDEPQRFEMWSDSELITPELAIGVVEPGEILTVYASVDATETDADVLAAQIGVAIADDSGIVDVAAPLFEADAGGCSFNFKRDNIKVTKGEGGFDPALELTVTTEANYGGGDYSKTWSGTIKPGQSYTNDSTIISSTQVPVGTIVDIPWTVSATEKDTWDADDHGESEGTLRFTCSGHSGQSTTANITLGNAAIAVRVKASW